MIKKRFFLGILVTGICTLLISSYVEATQTVKIAIPYTDQEVAGKNENNLKIFKFEVGSQTWTELSSTPHPSENYVEAKADSFGDKYAVAEVKLPTVTEFLYVYPNPVKKEDPLKIKFNLSQGMHVTIKIYLGQSEVATPYDGYISEAGEYEVKWTVNVVTNLYTCKVKLGSSEWSVKFIVIG
ncbi:MAG: hypothetical protein AB1414_06200 [bacterium]